MPNNRKTVLVSISLTPELLAGLEWLAAQNGRSRSGQLSWLIAKKIREKKLKKSPGTP